MKQIIPNLDQFISEGIFSNLGIGSWNNTNEICKRLIIDNRIKGTYKINSDLSVDVFGNVNFNNYELKKFPVKFNVIHNGYFSCDYCENLETLEGAPEKIINGHFSCSNNKKITSLNGAPKEIKGDFFIRNCGKEFTWVDVHAICKVTKEIITK